MAFIITPDRGVLRRQLQQGLVLRAGLWLLLVLAIPVSAADSDIRLARFLVASAAPGDWTEATFEVHNKGNEARHLMLSIQLGEVQDGMHLWKVSLDLPAQSKMVKHIPVLLPQLGSVMEKNLKEGKRNPIMPFICTIYDGAATLVRQKEFLGLKIVPQMYVSVDNRYEYPDFGERVLTRDARLGVFLHTSHALGKELRSRTHNKMQAGELPIWSRYHQQIHLLSDVTLSILEEEELLMRVADGALLICAPTFDVTRYWWAELQCEPLSAFVAGRLPYQSQLNPINEKAEDNEFIHCRQYAYGAGWTTWMSEGGVVLGAYRPYGNGVIVQSSWPLEDFLLNTQVEESLLKLSALQGNAYSAISDSRWGAGAQAWLDSHHGYEVWGQGRVWFYLLSFIVISASLVFLPIKRLSHEWRWLGWGICLLLWSVGAGVVLVFGKEGGTRLMAVALQVYSNQASGSANVAKQTCLSLVSSEKRSFALKWPEDWRWSENGISSNKTLMSDDHGFLAWTDFRLLPGIPSRLDWREFLGDAEDFKGSLHYGKTLKINTSKKWSGKGALILGRRVWLLEEGQMEVASDQGQLLSSLENTEGWTSLLPQLCRSGSGTQNVDGRAWLVRVEESDELGLELPEDVLVDYRIFRLGELDVMLAPEEKEFWLPAGVCDIGFLKGMTQSSESSETKAFDGCLWRETASRLRIVFSPPSPFSDLVIRQGRLHVELEAVSGQKLRVRAGGEDHWQNCIEREKGVVDIPVSAFNQGRLIVEISVTGENSALKTASWLLKHCELELRGNCQ